MEDINEIFHYIYFIESHDIFSNIKISLSENYSESNSLEIIEENQTTNKKATFSINIYRFKFFPNKISDKNKFEIEIIVEEEDKKYTKKINNLDFEHDNYLYNLNLESESESDLFNTNNKLEMNNKEKYDLFLNALKKKELDQNKKAKDDLIYSTLKLFIDNKKEKTEKYNSLFLFTLFIDAFETSYFPKLVEILRPNNIERFGDVPKPKILNVLEILDKIESNQFQIFENENNKEDLIFNCYAIKFLINYQLSKKTLNEILNNENIKNYIYKILINYGDIFSGLTLQKKQIIELLNIQDLNFLQLINKLRYNKDFLTILQIINEKKELFLNKYLEYNKEKEQNIFIDIESIVVPKVEDDINSIFEQIKDLFSEENNSIKQFLKISPNLFEKYMNLFFNVDLDKLISLKKIIELLKKEDKKYRGDIVQKLNVVIHQNGINFAILGKLKNLKLLNFIENDLYYTDKIYVRTQYRSVDILSGIDIKTINNEFLKQWKNLDIFKIFQYNKESFIIKICNLVNDINDLNILYKLLNKNKEENPIDLDNDSIAKLQEKYEDLVVTYSPEKSTHFLDDIIDLIYFSDYKKTNLNNFIEDKIQKSLDNETINNIYINLAKKYKISDNLTKLIIKYFLNNASNNNNISILINIIKNSKELRKPLLQKMNNYIINENDIYQKEDSTNYRLLEGLIKEGIFKIDDKDLKDTEYIKRSLQIMDSFISNIKKNDIKYANINYIFENKFDNILYKRLELISQPNVKEILDTKESIKSHLNDIKKTLNDLQFILNDLTFFCRNEKQKDIINIHELIRKIRKDTISDYIKKNKDEANKYILQYKSEAEKNEIKLKSAFYVTLNEQTRNIYPDNDQKCRDEMDEKMKKIKRIFSQGIKYSLKEFFNIGNKDSPETILGIVLRKFKSKNKDIKVELNKEIDILAKILEIKNTYDKNKIIDNLIILSEKENVLNICNSMKIFVDKLGSKKTKFYETIHNITSNIYKKKDIYTIRKSMEELEHYGVVDFNSDNTSYIEILIKLKEQPDAINFLFEKTVDDCREWLDIPLEADNDFLTPQDIIGLEKCIIFFQQLGSNEEIKQLTDKDLILHFKKLVDNNISISLFINQFINNYGSIKELINTYVDKNEMSKKKICDIYEESEFTLKNIKDYFFIGKYQCLNKNKEKKDIKYETILELRDRAQLSKVISGDEKEKEIIRKSQIFIEKVSEINNIYKMIKEIYNKGYHKNIKIEIKIKKGISTIKYDEKPIKYNQLISDLQLLLDDLKTHQINAYKKNVLIRYIYGRQFHLLYNNIQNIEGAYDNRKKIKTIIPFLKYITNEMINEEIILDSIKFSKTGNLFDDLINTCEDYLKTTLEINGLSLENIYEDSKIRIKYKSYEYKGLYIYLCDKLEKELFQIYKYLTSKNPIAQNILLCNQDTLNEEIISFLYRAILCEFNVCFIVGGIELLNSEQKATLLEILNGLFMENHDKMNSCLIFLYTSKSTDIYKSLDAIKYRKILRLEDLNKVENEKYEKDDIEIIFSDKPGVGKSFNINKTPRNTDGYFPFGGVITRKDTIERLKDLKYKNNLIHLDLYDTEQIQLMMEFLFSILITKLYGESENIFYLSKNVKIKVEIPNSFIDFFLKFPILNLFKQTKLTINKLAPLRAQDKAFIQNEQLVSNYLKAKKEERLNTGDLYVPKISPKTPEEKFNELKRKSAKKLLLYKYDEIVNIPEDECQKFILDEMKSLNETNPSYFQITTFVNVLAMLLKDFTANNVLSASSLLLLTNEKETPLLRKYIIDNFIKITKYFTQGAFDNLLKSQRSAHEMIFGQYDEGKDITNAIDDLSVIEKDKQFTFNNLKSPIIFFHQEDNEQFSILLKEDQKKEDYQTLSKLREVYKKLLKKDCLINFENSKQEQYLKYLKRMLNLDNPILKKDKKEKTGLKSLEEITNNYVFTEDNFIKMIFILMRIKAKIPVIMMGETGCGKTLLIRKLSEIMNNGDEDKMLILNIHAGTTNKEIIEFIQKKVLPNSIKLIRNSTSGQIERDNKKDNNKKSFIEKKIWVFLDEINTCKSLGLITELMSKNSYQGTPLYDNIVFIGACNPYRKRKADKIQEENGLDVNLAVREKNNLNDKEKEKIKQNSLNSKKLVYSVNPLPHSLLNYVFDFGSLTPEQEEKYIERMVHNNNIFHNNKVIKENILNKVKELAKKMIIESQNFIRESNDVSSVSLREISRFNIFLEFFYNHLLYKKNNAEKLMDTLELESDYTFYQSKNELDIIIFSINLSIYLCYYLRITKKESRDDLEKELNKILSSYDISKHEDFNFLKIVNREQEFLLKNIELEKGISKNRALLENIFALFAAINNKVPIFIVGKPGCSKSLSVHLIYKAMKGSQSTNSLFKTLPKVVMNSYQGSMGSTSKGVENIFKKARNILKIYNTNDEKDKDNKKNKNSIKDKEKDKDKEKIISMIFFDEMGLAEHSPNNPLKVLHSELEYDLNESQNNENKVAFVGISNWRLDASKMNRGLFISIPEADEEDTKNTAFTIGKSFNKILAEKHKVFLENLGKIYLNYRKYLKEKHSLDGKEDFHGNRDFYHLVKNIGQSMNLKYNNNEDILDDDLIKFGIKGIERNFAGIVFDDTVKKTSVEIVKGYFNDFYNRGDIKKDYDVIERVKENINDLISRYLLVESKSSISTYLLSSILSELNKNYYFLVGSKFEKDLQSEEYILKVLNKIQIYMEQGKILIMKNLDSVYPSMYDLFNQNFTEISNKKYARLAIGSSTNTFSLINKDFRCIINIDMDEIDKQEAPFLNRFEKQIISFEYLLNKDLLDESNKIINILNELTNKKKNYKGINYDLKKLLINCDPEEIRGMIYDANKNQIEKEKLLDEILSKISLTLPQDIVLHLKYNGFNKKYQKVYKAILKYYNTGEHINLSRFIKTMKNAKNVIYTFSNEFDKIEDNINVNNPIYGSINKENIKIILLNSLKSEFELESQINNFISNNKYKLCIFKFTPDEGSMMNYLKYFIENKEKELNLNNEAKENNKKIFIFIMHISRVFDKELKDLEMKNEKEKKEINKKIIKESMSNLSGYYQTFIDNLNGDEKLALDTILKMKGKELFSKCLDLDEELIRHIYLAIAYMKYKINSSIGGLNKDTYINKIIHYIENNKSIRQIMNDCILNGMDDIQGDLIDKIFKKQDIIEEKDIDIIGIIRKYLSLLYRKNLNLLIFKAEKDLIFSSLLSFDELENEKNNYSASMTDKNIKGEDVFEIIRNIAKRNKQDYFNNLILKDINIRLTERIGSNNLNIILGLNLPGVKPFLDKIIQKVRDEVINKYYQNEINLRGYQKKNIEDDEKNELQNEIQNYNFALNRCNNSTLTEIEKQEFFISNIKYWDNNPIYLNAFYDILYEDYYTLYVNNNLNKSNDNNFKTNNKKNENKEKGDENEEINDKYNIDHTKKFLKLLISLKFNLSNNFDPSQTEFLASTINWLESYEVEITILLRMFSKLDNIVPDLYHLVEYIIYGKTIKYEISERNPSHTAIVNEIFFYGMESILRVITSNISIYSNLENSENEMNRLQNLNKEILQDAKQLDTNLNLYSKEVYSLQEIIELIDAFNMNKVGTIENISTLIYYFNLQKTFINNNDLKDALSNNLYNLYQFIYDLIGKDKNFHKIMNKVLFNEFLKVFDEEYRLQILKIILKDNNFIINSTQIIKIIIKNYISNEPSDDLIYNIEKLSNKYSSLISLLISTNSSFLDEILLNIFEGELIHYFESIPLIKDKEIQKEKFPKFYSDNDCDNISKEINLTGIIFDESFKIFKKFVENLESIIKEKNNENSKLSKLYSIAYIKIYLNYFVTFIKNKKLKTSNIKEIVNYICSNESKFRYVLKIYILKLFNNLMESFEQFKNFNFEKCGIEFHKEFSLWNEKLQKKSEELILNYCFMTLDNEIDKKNFDEQQNFFSLCKYNYIEENGEKIINNINQNGIDSFLCICINKDISNLGYKEIKNKRDFNIFYNFVNNIFNGKYKCNDNLKKLLFLFFDEKKFNDKIKNKLMENNNINSRLFEMILYSFRFCVQSLDALDIQKKNNIKKKLLYASILDINCSDNINKCFIPGNDIQEDMHITTLDFIQAHLNSNPDNIGCYVCSCGYYYSIQPCGFPTRGSTSVCPVCKLNIGYGERKIIVGYHGLVRRPGHLRIFKDEQQQKTCMNRYGDSSENVPNMTYSDYCRDIIKPIMNKNKFGINNVTRDWFLRRDKKVRKLNELSFRILNFILYSHLFFANCLGFISDINLDKYLIKDMKCIDIIKKDWEFIQEILQKKGIQSIQIFMNLIFKRLSQLIKNCEYFTSAYLRDNFEEKIEDLINKCLSEYNNYSIGFIEENKKELELDNYNIKTIINELSPPTEDKYPPHEYPLFKYFILTKYSTKEDFIKKLGPSNIYVLKYPLLYQYLLDNIDTKKIKYLPAFNEFTNYMIENYSFKISRDDAKKRKLENEPIFKEEGFINKYNNFIEAWDEIKNEAIKYKCRPEMPPKKLSSEEKLIYFLNDDGELGYGMYLAAAFQNFIVWQNTFLQPIIENVAQNGILHYFVKNMQRKIPVQNAKINQTLLIEDCFNNSLYYNFEDILSTFCRRDIFKENGTINYYNYNSFIYDFSSIEEEFGKLLLPGKCLFENEDNLNFVAYWSEGFRGCKSDTLTNFYIKYPQKDLNDEEREKIIKYISKKRMENNYDFNLIFGSMQLIIFYLSNNSYKNDEKIINILKNAPNYLKIEEDYNELFENEGKEFKLEKLMNVYFFIEHLCYNGLVNTLQREYKREIPKDLKIKIKAKLLEPNKKWEGYTIKQLAAAVRRYISRYLAGKRESVDIDEKRDLTFELTRIDLWEEKIGRIDNLDELLFSQIGEFKLKVDQAYEFYQLIEEEDPIPIVK